MRDASLSVCGLSEARVSVADACVRTATEAKPVASDPSNSFKSLEGGRYGSGA